MDNIISLVPKKLEGENINSEVIEDLEKLLSELKDGQYRQIQTAVLLMMEEDGRVSRVGLTSSPPQDTLTLMTIATQICMNSILRVD